MHDCKGGAAPIQAAWPPRNHTAIIRERLANRELEDGAGRLQRIVYVLRELRLHIPAGESGLRPPGSTGSWPHESRLDRRVGRRAVRGHPKGRSSDAPAL